MVDPSKKVILITGSSRGIGKVLAEHYLSNGWCVVGCSRGEGSIVNDNYKHFSCSVADEKGVKAIFGYLQKEHGVLTALINNAGRASMNHALLTPLSKLQELVDANLTGTFLFSREGAKLMSRKRYGRIVNFSTVAVPLSLEGEAAYVATKSAVVSLTKVLAKELGPLGITVNAVGPTPVKTDLISGVPDNKLEKLLDAQAIRRFGEFRDVVNAVDFFIKPESDFITGQILYLGGV
jgi:3-oxoacyl-[acyl-carrier protein] reductase